ncbi:MAG: protein-disulfide isomerase [Planctomycetaceae bacterium]|nr:MAG: protein-disulfide isomerase [Planctomycetaceae bacterium]
MTLDLYSLCPSGNGKKIKFCKCQDSLSELDKIVTMVTGGQVVPALDRLNRMLAEHPDAACALAIKGRILLNLREFDLLAENAERFVRLQPTNPLALTQRAVAQMVQGKLGEATESILEAISESGNKFDSFVLEVTSMLAYQLLESGQFLAARAYAMLVMMTEGFEGQEAVASLLERLNTDPAVSHLVKALPSHRPRPERAEWGERFDEALGLLRSHRITLANTKFSSLARAYPNEPSILSGLLTCAIWRADSKAQVDCLKRLAQCEQLDPTQRSKFLAMAWLSEPGLQDLSVELMSMKSDVEDVARDEQALRSNPYFAEVPDATLRSLVASEDEVPPRSGFQLLDQPLPSSETTITGENLSETLALVLVFGKQTDRPARIEVKAVLPMFLEVVRRTLAETLEKLPWVEEPYQSVPFVMASDPRPAWADRPNYRKNLEPILAEFRQSRFAHRMTKQPLPALNLRSLADAANDPNLTLQREAILRVLENTESLAQNPELLDQVRQESGVAPLPPLVLKTADELEQIENSDLPRVDCQQLDGEGLRFLMSRARLLQMGQVLREVSREALSREEVPGDADDANFRSGAYLGLIESSDTFEESLRWIAEAKSFFVKRGLDTANLLLVELSTRIRAGDLEGFQTTLRTLTTEHSHREEVMQILQQMLISLGLLNPDGSPRRGPMRPGAAPEPPASAGGIWTPDGGGAPDAPASGKLWVPGMD